MFDLSRLPAILVAISSPSQDHLDLGPFTLRYYGFFIALGAVVAVWIAARRFRQAGQDPQRAITLAWLVIPAGLVGARLYHVITDWKMYQGRWGDAIKIWEGGLGIPGGVLAGAVAGVLLCRYYKWQTAQVLDIVAPALLAAQAIGRLGNWFNQELFGKPTDLFWGLEIDPGNRPASYSQHETFHPTFAYEALWNLGVMLVLLALDRHRRKQADQQVARAASQFDGGAASRATSGQTGRQVSGLNRLLPAGSLFALYVLGYASGRLWIEFLRIDPASMLLGVRVNVWVMSVLWIGAFVVLVVLVLRSKSAFADPARDGPAGTPAPADAGTSPLTTPADAGTSPPTTPDESESELEQN